VLADHLLGQGVGRPFFKGMAWLALMLVGVYVYGCMCVCMVSLIIPSYMVTVCMTLPGADGTRLYSLQPPHGTHPSDTAIPPSL